MSETCRVIDKSTQANEKWQDFILNHAKVSTDRNRWFVACLVLIALTFFSVNYALSVGKKASDNLRVAFVKMHPNGGWDVELDEKKYGPSYFSSTIDSHLISFIENRFSMDPNTIVRDYTISENFMSSDLHRDFVSADGFNAAKVASDFTKCLDCHKIEAHVTTINQYDVAKMKINKETQDVYRTHVFVNEVIKNNLGKVVDKKRKIATLEWRFRQKHERDNSHDMLKYNPLNIEIRKVDYMDSPETVGESLK